jgi:hypothetical protein
MKMRKKQKKVLRTIVFGSTLESIEPKSYVSNHT